MCPPSPQLTPVAHDAAKSFSPSGKSRDCSTIIWYYWAFSCRREPCAVQNHRRPVLCMYPERHMVPSSLQRYAVHAVLCLMSRSVQVLSYCCTRLACACVAIPRVHTAIWIHNVTKHDSYLRSRCDIYLDPTLGESL